MLLLYSFFVIPPGLDQSTRLCIISYMFELRRTAQFIDWLVNLRDVQARARIAKRLDRLVDGNFGDVRSVGGGVSELRFTFGPGYRVYFTVRNRQVVILLCGGDKSSQDRDIKAAKQILKDMGESK